MRKTPNLLHQEGRSLWGERAVGHGDDRPIDLSDLALAWPARP